MRQNKKGFTLIELLAVIVILAIIALIATPIVLNMINSARKSAAKSSSLGFIDSIEYYAGFAQANGTTNELGLGDYNQAYLPTSGVVCEKASGSSAWTGGTDSLCANLMVEVEKKSKGKAPDSAKISIDASGKVRETSWLNYGKFYCSYNGSDIDGDCGTSEPSTTVQVFNS